jgi:hypothetical protein
VARTVACAGTSVVAPVTSLDNVVSWVTRLASSLSSFACNVEKEDPVAPVAPVAPDVPVAPVGAAKATPEERARAPAVTRAPVMVLRRVRVDMLDPLICRLPENPGPLLQCRVEVCGGCEEAERIR